MKKTLFLLFIIYYSLFTSLNAASVEASVNTTEVVNGNPVQLRIKVMGGSAAFPSINEINGTRVISAGTSTRSFTSITSSGMKNESSTVKKYIFTPEQDMTIPAYIVNVSGTNYKTKPIHIKVVQSKAPTAHNNGKFSFDMKSDKDSVFVGESFVTTIYMSVSDTMKDIQISDYVAPTASGLFIKEIAGQKEYQNGGYTVIEKKYVMTTKKEGNFTISSAMAKLGQPDWTRQDIFGRPNMKWMRIVSNTLDIEVKAQAVDTDLVGVFTLDKKLDNRSVKANKPVNLTVTINGTGNLEDFEFPKYEIDGVTIYSDEAKVESHIENDVLVGTYSKSFAFISEDDFSIPARSITMYNPQTKETKSLEIPKYEVSIVGKKVAKNIPSSSNIQTKITQSKKSKEVLVEKKVEVKSIAWWMLALAVALGMLLMYFLQVMLRRIKKGDKSYKESDALKVLYAHISEGKEVEEMVRKLYAKKNGDKSIKIDKKELKEMMNRF